MQWLSVGCVQPTLHDLWPFFFLMVSHNEHSSSSSSSFTTRDRPKSKSFEEEEEPTYGISFVLYLNQSLGFGSFPCWFGWTSDSFGRRPSVLFWHFRSREFQYLFRQTSVQRQNLNQIKSYSFFCNNQDGICV